MKPLRRTAALLVLSILLCGCGPKAEEEPVWVGLVASFSGPDRTAGLQVKQGVELAVDDAVNQRVEGRRLAVVTVDDRGTDESVRAEAVRLLSLNRVAALIGGADAGRATLLARTAQPYGVPTVLPCEVAGLRPDASFALGVRPAWRGQILALYASGELRLKRTAVLIDGRNPVAVELAAAFVKEWPGDEGASVQQETFRSDAELREQAPRLAAARPAVVLIAADTNHFQLAREMLQSLPDSLLFYGGEDVDVEGLSAGHGDVVTATVMAREELTDRGRAFVKRYAEHFHESAGLAAVQGYDAARLLFDAMERAKTSAADKVRDQLAATTDFESLTGPLRFKDGLVRRRVFVVRRSDGQTKVVQHIDAETDAGPDGGR